MSSTPKRSFKEQMHQARERAILHTACELLGAKSFDAMTMDDVAGGVGIAKASLYKHFDSKEKLCCAAMVQVLEQVQAHLAALPAELAPQERLRALVRWSLERLLASEMPLLPGSHSALRAVLLDNPDYAAGVARLSEQVNHWIAQAQAQGSIDAALPVAAVRYTLYARACDPMVSYLKDSGEYSDEEIVALALRTCFGGLG